jgi:hypothetical protein
MFHLVSWSCIKRPANKKTKPNKNGGNRNPQKEKKSSFMFVSRQRVINQSVDVEQIK